MLGTWIKENFHTEPITLEKSGIKIFRSSQVNLRTIDESLKYRIITAYGLGMLHKVEEYPSKKVGANPKSLKNQTLQVGDILISSRAKLETIGLVTKKVLEPGISTVAMNGMIIVRTGNENLSNFIKYYLKLPEVQDSINNDPRASKNGKRIIPIELISELQFPDIFNNNFQAFKKYNDYFESIISKAHDMNAGLNLLVNYQLAGSSAIDIDNENSYNLDEWKKIDESLNSLNENLANIISSIKIPVGYTHGNELIAMFTPLLEGPSPTPNQANGKT